MLDASRREASRERTGVSARSRSVTGGGLAGTGSRAGGREPIAPTAAVVCAGVASSASSAAQATQIACARGLVQTGPGQITWRFGGELIRMMLHHHDADHSSIDLNSDLSITIPTFDSFAKYGISVTPGAGTRSKLFNKQTKK